MASQTRSIGKTMVPGECNHFGVSPYRWALLAMASLVPAGTVSAAAEAPYWVWLQDSTQMTGKQLQVPGDPRQPFKLDGRPLTRTGNPARVIRHTALACDLSGPFVELTNGDVLPGRTDRVEGSQPGAPTVPCLVVSPAASDRRGVSRSRPTKVRLDAVRRIVFHGPPELVHQAGRMVFRDGRRLTARTLRFAAGSVRALTSRGVIDTPFDELAEVHVPDRDLLRGVLSDSLWLPSDADSRIVRMRTTDGAQLTFRLAHMTNAFPDDEDRREKIAVFPAWSVEGVVVDVDRIGWWTFRLPGEVPLSLLPTAHVQQSAGLHRWPWRRNRNVFGTMLATGPYASDLGLGTHSQSEITFELPPHAQHFSTTVGLDPAAGRGGCVTCRVYRDDDRSAPLWQREFHRGTDPPVNIGPLNVSPAKRLTLTTEFAHERRPRGADPFDVRDHVDWLMPLVTVDPAATEKPPVVLARWVPQLSGWQPAEWPLERVSPRPWWSRRYGRWEIAMVPDAEKRIADAPPLELTRNMRITLSNALVHLAVGRDRADSTHHGVSLLVDGESQQTTMNGELGSNAGPDDAHERFWILHQHVGKEANVALRLTPRGDAGATPAGVIWHTADFGPLIENLPTNGKLLEPDVLLTSVTPVTVDGGAPQDLKLKPGELMNGQPLNILGYRFDAGFGTNCNLALTYKLDPTWRRFVAAVGLADGWQAVGPYEILFDGEPHFQTAEPHTFGRNTPGQQLDVPIPPGHATITLRVQGSESQAAWVNAGFMLD